MSFKKILLAIDDSKYSRKGLDLVVKIAGEAKTPVVLVHVLTPVTGRIPTKQREELMRELVEEARQEHASYRAALEELGIAVSFVTPEGEPSDEILLTAKQENCDLIVIGARRHGNIGGLLLGSVTHQILYRAEVPVLVAR
jgi:nucleotide-binding universal stress UspA family protein